MDLQATRRQLVRAQAVARSLRHWLTELGMSNEDITALEHEALAAVSDGSDRHGARAQDGMEAEEGLAQVGGAAADALAVVDAVGQNTADEPEALGQNKAEHNTLPAVAEAEALGQNKADKAEQRAGETNVEEGVEEEEGAPAHHGARNAEQDDSVAENAESEQHRAESDESNGVESRAEGNDGDSVARQAEGEFATEVKQGLRAKADSVAGSDNGGKTEEDAPAADADAKAAAEPDTDNQEAGDQEAGDQEAVHQDVIEAALEGDDRVEADGHRQADIDSQRHGDLIKPDIQDAPGRVNTERDKATPDHNGHKPASDEPDARQAKHPAQQQSNGAAREGTATRARAQALRPRAGAATDPHVDEGIAAAAAAAAAPRRESDDAGLSPLDARRDA